MPPAVETLTLRVEREGAAVPALAWLPATGRPSPVVLLGHGGSGSKRSPRNERLGQWFAAHGVAAMAIDGPFHGERVAEPMSAPAYQQLMVERGVEAVIDGMVQDWRAALAVVTATGRVDPDRCGYLGLSLGSRFGIPVAADLGPRLRCAVFGKFGLLQSGAFPAGLGRPGLTRIAAGRITAPLLLHMQWDDELFPRDGALALFDALASADKTLLARPGPHAGTHPDDEPTWRSFIRAHLAPQTAPHGDR
jgi:dienelactone hydrolase